MQNATNAVDGADVVIIGGGVSGLSSAYFLAKAGMDVVVVEKGAIGREASGRNGGSLSPRADEPDVIPLAALAREVWSTLDLELGYPTEFVQKGRLQVALTEEEVDLVHAMRDNSGEHGIEARMVDFQEMRDMVPELSEKALAGIFFPNVGHANPQRTVQAYAWAFQDRGGRIYQNTSVTGINLRSGRVASVETTAGVIGAGVVVSAAGPQTGMIADMVGLTVPVAPARVEILATVPLEPRFDMFLSGNGLYGRQTLRGNLVFGGGPHEWIDVELAGEPPKPNTPLVRNIARRLAELLPELDDLSVLRAWGGVVEQTPDGYPIIDMPGYPEGFVVVTVSGNGFGLSPATGKTVSQLIVDGETSIPIERFRLDRFKDLPRGWRRAWGWEPGAYNT
ncbi:MAG: FAD-binding oxidoreductase [Chloroflexi bacterium]|nr:FAD-binding oxidoreductase [Chloroflexota bacterium]